MLDALDAAAVRRWSRACVTALAEHRAEIDALNVFPVPDTDTGSNLLLTMRAADDALAAVADGAGPGPDAVTAAGALDAMARGAALGAVGNSGFIVSQVVRGLAEAAAARADVVGDAAGDPAAGDPPGDPGCGLDAAWLRAGLDRGASLARSAVVAPVEGTILTVARAAADGATGGSLGEVAGAALRAADEALQHTPEQLAELAAAGVVDAGGRGLLVLLDELVRVVTGVEAPLGPVEVAAATAAVHGEAGGSDFGYEVQYLLDAGPDAVERLRGALATLGDSVAVVQAGQDLWKVHVHVDDVGAAVEAGIEAGRPHGISVVRFADPAHAAAGPQTCAVLAVAPGAGLAHLFEAEGVHVVDGEPSVDAVAAAVEATGARSVVVLPNATTGARVAEQAAQRARSHGIRVAVVPTRSPVQGLAAIAVHDPARRFDDDVVAMAEAAAATRFAEVMVADGPGLTAVGICQAGDVLGLIDGDVVEIGRGLLAVSFTLVDRLLGVGAELMTVLVGADAPKRIGELIEAHVRGRAPLTDVTVYDSGQPGLPVIIGVE